FFFSSRRRHTRFSRDWSSDVCSSDLHFVRRNEVEVARDGLLQGRGRHGEFQRIAGIVLAEQSRDEATRKGVAAAHAVDELNLVRSEERRVGKECRARWSTYPDV